MKWPIFEKECKHDRLSLAVYSVASAAMVWLYVAMYPSLQTQGRELTKLISSLPSTLLKAFNIEGTGLESLESLLASKQFNFILPILLIIFLLSRAANYLAGEAEHNTIGTLLSQPVSRVSIYWSKYLAGMTNLCIFTSLSILIALPLGWAYHLHPPLKPYALLTGMALLFGWCVFSLGMLASAISNTRSHVYAVVGGGLMGMYVINLIASLNPELSKLRFVSFFHYFDPNRLLLHSEFSLGAALLFSLLAVSAAVAGSIYFNKRDYSI